MSDKNDRRKMLKVVEQHGWVIEYGAKHLKLRSPDGRIVIVSKTPSCPHALNQARRDLRKYGVDI